MKKFIGLCFFILGIVHLKVGLEGNSIMLFLGIAFFALSLVLFCTSTSKNQDQAQEILDSVSKKEAEDDILSSATPKKISMYEKSESLPDDYIVLDLETTGLSPTEDHIIQVAAVKYENGVKISEFSEYVYCPVRIPEKITRMTGITNEMVLNCRKISDILSDLVTYLGSNYIVCHNASFDMSFLQTKLLFYKFETLNNKVVDTLTLSRRTMKDVENHKLETLKKFLKLDFPSHNALCDCYVTAAVLEYCKKKEHRKNDNITISVRLSGAGHYNVPPDPEEDWVINYLLELSEHAIDPKDIHIEHRAKSYASVILYENDDFLRFNSSAGWFSVSVWGIDNLDLDDERFKNISDKKQRHWKFYYDDIKEFHKYDDVILKSMQVSINKHEETDRADDIELTEDEQQYKDEIYQILRDNGRNPEKLVCTKSAKYFDIGTNYLRFKLTGKLRYWLVFEEEKKFTKKHPTSIAVTPGSEKEGGRNCTRVFITSPDDLRNFKEYILTTYDRHDNPLAYL